MVFFFYNIYIIKFSVVSFLIFQLFIEINRKRNRMERKFNFLEEKKKKKMAKNML